jgi:hypothetical protein
MGGERQNPDSQKTCKQTSAHADSPSFSKQLMAYRGRQPNDLPQQRFLQADFWGIDKKRAVAAQDRCKQESASQYAARSERDAI